MGPKKKTDAELAEEEAIAKAEEEAAKTEAARIAEEERKNPPSFDGQSDYVVNAAEVYDEIGKLFPVEVGKAVR